MKYFKKTLVVITITIMTLLNVTSVSADTNNKVSLDQQIEQAHKIKLVQKFFSFSTSYDIIIKGETVGQIKGDFFHPFGDTLRIIDHDNNTIYSEQQQSRWMNLSLTRGGVFINQNDQTDGAIREEMFMLFNHQFRIFNSNGQHIGQSYQDPWHFFSTYYKITNKNKDTVIQGEMESLHLTKQITVSKIKASKISMKQALIIMTIEEAIDDAESSKSND